MRCGVTQRSRLICRAEDSQRAKAGQSARRHPLDWLKRAPRIRYRRPENRCPDQLLDLTVLNERLMGSSPWEVRRKVEYLKKRQENWDRVYEVVMKGEAAATLKTVEDASQKVEVALSQESKESKSVVELKKELTELQKEVREAHEKLHATQSRVSQNLNHVQYLKTQLEAAASQLRTAPGSFASAERQESLQTGILQHWYPVAFSNSLREEGLLLPFELYREPWVLFRDAEGRPVCLQDECAHRACPLSIGKVVEGIVSCPYHGWEYNNTGSCVKMPSTVFQSGISVRSLPAEERDGFIWVWPGTGTPPLTERPDCTEVAEDFVVLSEVEMTVKVDSRALMSHLLDDAYTPSHPLFKQQFNSNTAQEGEWTRYSMKSLFFPPCSVSSVLDAADSARRQKRRRIHQLHVCLPVGDEEVRVLQRLSANCWKWASQLPLAQKAFKSIAEKALVEDVSRARRHEEKMKKMHLHA